MYNMSMPNLGLEKHKSIILFKLWT